MGAPTDIMIVPAVSGGAAAPRPRPRAAAPPPAVQPRREAAHTGHRVTLVLFTLLAAVNVLGMPYYLLPSAARVRSPLHAWLKPTGYVGQAAGLLSMGLFLFLWLYPLRKKIRWLAFTGSLSRWLDVHIVVGLCIPFLAAIHAAWHFTGLIGLGYGAMLVVWLSGIVGKYFYARIPRSRSGLELSLEEVNGERTALLRYIAGATGIPLETVHNLLSVDARPYAGLGPLRTVWRMIGDDLERHRVGRKFRLGLRGAMPHGRRVDRRVMTLVSRLARRQMALSQQVRMLDATHQLFRYWHVAHRPVAVTALIAVLVHVVTAVALGVTWLY